MKNLTKVIAIVGPTATGKSDLGVFIAQALKKNGLIAEIVSADSRQVYRGMDLGSGKITKKEMRGIKHHLLDVASPKSASFNAAKFKTAAEKEIKRIMNQKRVPIIVGGTGFWIDALLSGQEFPDVLPNPKLRAKLQKYSAQKLFEMLKKLDPTRAKNIDQKNKRRLIRAIEIAQANQKIRDKKLGNKIGTKNAANNQPHYQTLFIGLDMDSAKLRGKIEKRLDIRLKKGMIKEVQKLHRQGVSWKTLENFGLEYRFVSQYLQNKIDKQKMRELLLFAVWHYAKRQRTWFKRNQNIIWLDPTKKATAAKAIALSKKFLKN